VLSPPTDRSRALTATDRRRYRANVIAKTLDKSRSRRAHPAKGPAEPEGVPSVRTGTGAVPWRLTTRHLHGCTSCRRAVNPEFMEIIVARNVWVFCGKPCALEWEGAHRGKSLNPGGVRST
jgi:hypothetical protein